MRLDAYNRAMDTVNAAGLILIVFAGFELMRWLDRLLSHLSDDEVADGQSGQETTQAQLTQTFTPVQLYATQDVALHPKMTSTRWED